MIAPTCSVHPSSASRDLYRRNVARLADEVLAAGACLRPLVDAFGAWVEETGRERRRTQAEYLLEALTLGVLWRARGADVTRREGVGRAFVAWLARWRRRAGAARRRDGSTGLTPSVDAPCGPGAASPTLRDLDALLTWVVASGAYDDEVARLEAWEDFLRADPGSAGETLEEFVAFAAAFEGWSARALGMFTEGAERLRLDDLPRGGWREETIPCAPRRIEYHLSMIRAELRDRPWREAFLGSGRHAVATPGCRRPRPDDACVPRDDAAAPVPRAA